MCIVKKVWSLLLVFTLTLSFTLTAAVPAGAAAAANNTIKFPDPKLEAAVRAEIKKSSGTITVNDVKGLQSLDLYNKGISSLEGLQHFTGLKDLWMCANKIKDLKPIAGLINLVNLSFTESSVTDLTPLKNLTKLENLYVDFSPFSDITPLAGLTNLKSLGLSNTKVSNLTPLKNLTKLQSLSLNSTPVSDLTPLSKLTELLWLNLENTKVSDITPLENLTKLQELKLKGSPVKDYTPTIGYYHNLKDPDFEKPELPSRPEPCLIWKTPQGYEKVTKYNYVSGFLTGWTFTNYFKAEGVSGDIEINANITRDDHGWSTLGKTVKVTKGKYYKVSVDVGYDAMGAKYLGNYSLQFYYGYHMFDQDNPTYKLKSDDKSNGTKTSCIGKVQKIEVVELDIPASPDFTVKVNQKQLNLGMDATIVSGTPYVPIEAVFKEMGAKVTADSKTKAVTLEKGSKRAVLTPDSRKIMLNNEKVNLEGFVILVNGKLMAPVKTVVEKMGGTYQWDGAARSMTITMK